MHTLTTNTHGFELALRMAREDSELGKNKKKNKTPNMNGAKSAADQSAVSAKLPNEAQPG